MKVKSGEKKFKEEPFKKICILILTVILAVTMITGTASGAEAPSVKGKAAIIYCATTGEIVWEKNADSPLNPASMTKLMTCLLAIENLDLDQQVEVTAEATDVIPTKIYLTAGEKITVRDLLYASLLESANDAAAALAVAVSGSIEDFAELMNERAAAIGCTNTHFENPHGLAGEEHYSSARDIARISAEAFQNPTLREIAATEKYTIEETNKAGARELENGNLFLTGGEQETPNGIVKVKKYEGVFGGKTGTSETQVATMTVGLSYDGLEIYAVIMGTTMQQRFSDIKKLLDYGKENVSRYAAFEAGQEFEQGKVLGGATNRVTGVAAETGYIYLPEGASESLLETKAVYDENLEAPIEAGQKVGVAEIYLADEKVREIDLLAKESVAKGWILSRFGITNFQTVILCVAAALLLAFFVIIFVLRAVNKRKRKKQRQKKIMEMARRELEREKDIKQRDWPY